MQQIVSYLSPILTTMVTILIPVVIGVLVRMFSKIGVDIDAKNREALQSALENAAQAAITKMNEKPPAGQVQNFLGPTLMAIALSYMRKSVPDALKRFGLDQDEGKLIELLLPHIAKAVQKKFSLTTPQ